MSRARKCHISHLPYKCHRGFVSFYVETYLMHWAQRIEDTGALDVDVYYYLFIYLAVRTQYNQKDLQEDHHRGLHNNNNNHKYKYQ